MKGQAHRPIIDNALQRTLRSRMTDAENRLWRQLRHRQMAGWKFRRQHPFMDYVLDFVCLERRLVVEVDGGQHLDNPRNLVRDRRLQEAGFRTLRFWNNQVLQETDAVAAAIFLALGGDFAPPAVPSPVPAPIPSPTGGPALHSRPVRQARRDAPRIPCLTPLKGRENSVPGRRSRQLLPLQGGGREGDGDMAMPVDVKDVR